MANSEPKYNIQTYRIIYVDIHGKRHVVTIDDKSAPDAVEKVKKQANAEMNLWYMLIDVKRVLKKGESDE